MKRQSGSYVASDILADDIGGNRGLTTGRHSVLLSLEAKRHLSFLDILEKTEVTRSSLKNDLEWLTVRRLTRRETFRGAEVHSITEKGRFLVALLREYETRAEEAEAGLNLIQPFIERLYATKAPLTDYLEGFAQEYENVANNLLQRAGIIRETIREEQVKE